MRRTRLAIALILVALPVAAIAQQPNGGPPGPPSAAGTDVGNWGLVPFTVGPAVLLDEQGRARLRALEDKHLAELRALEDRFAQELLELRARQAAERSALLAAPR